MGTHENPQEPVGTHQPHEKFADQTKLIICYMEFSPQSSGQAGRWKKKKIKSNL